MVVIEVVQVEMDGGRVEEKDVLNRLCNLYTILRHRSGLTITTNDVIHPHPIIKRSPESRLNQPEFVEQDKMTSPFPSTSTGFSRIQTDQDLADFRKSPGYLDFISWVQRRCERVRGKRVDNGSEGCSEVSPGVLSGMGP